MADTYTCEMCKGVYEKEWSDKEAMEEAERQFPGMDHTDMVLLCDDCYQKVQAAAGRQQGPFN